MKHARFDVEGYELAYDVDGETMFGTDDVLLHRDDNLIQPTAWAAQGFTIEPFLSHAEYASLVTGIQRLLYETLLEFIAVEWDTFRLETYHCLIPSDALHLAFINRTAKGFPFGEFPIDLKAVINRVSEICRTQVVPHHENRNFFIRIVRPGKLGDNNPPHRDVWLDRLRNAVNIYVPLAGSTAQSSLPLIPGSHLWKESEIERTVSGARINGLSYSVPSVTGSTHKLRMRRPNPKPNEILVFSPYLIHGGGINLNPDTTRMSLELRFWRKTDSSTFPNNSDNS